MYIDLPFLLIYVSPSELLLVHDLCTGLLPDRFACPLLRDGLTYHQYCRPAQLSDALWGAIANYGVFALFYWGYRLICRQEGLGFSDVKFLTTLGAWHRWELLPPLALLTVGMTCCLTGISCVRYGKRVLKNLLPFGSYLAAASFIIGLVSMILDGWSLTLICDCR